MLSPFMLSSKLYGELLSPFLARIAEGSPLACIESHLTVSQLLLDAFEPGCWWSR